MAADLHQEQLLLSPPPFPFPSQSHQQLISSEQSLKVSCSPSESDLESSLTSPLSTENGRGGGGGGGGGEYDDIEMDFTAELTRRMAYSMLQEDDQFPLPSIGLSEHYQSGSNFGRFMGLKGSWSSDDSPPSPPWSPPVTPVMEAEVECDHGVPYDLINRFQKIDLAKKGLKQYDSYPSMPALLPFSHHQNLVHRSNLAASEDTDLRRMQLNEPIPAQNKRRTGRRRCHQQHQRARQVSGSGMQAVFLGGPGTRNGSGGTGVFLPRGAGNSTESRKQPRCSTALIPARVVQALMTHFERVGSQPLWMSTDGRSGSPFKQKSQYPAAPGRSDDDDISLPQEWNY